MTNILSIPEEISENLNFFKSVFSKPQFCRFTNQILSRIIDIRFSTYSIPEHFFHTVDPSTENRFLTQAPWDDAKVERKFYEQV